MNVDNFHEISDMLQHVFVIWGKVRKVMSGDYLFIEILRQNKPKGEPREFKRVTLSEIIAPRIAKKDDQFDVVIPKFV